MRTEGHTDAHGARTGFPAAQRGALPQLYLSEPDGAEPPPSCPPPPGAGHRSCDSELGEASLAIFLPVLPSLSPWRSGTQGLTETQNSLCFEGKSSVCLPQAPCPPRAVLVMEGPSPASGA